MRLLRALSFAVLVALPAAGCASVSVDLDLRDDPGDSFGMFESGVTCRDEPIGELCMTGGQWNLYESRRVGYHDYD